jgi:hypothetical protein
MFNLIAFINFTEIKVWIFKEDFWLFNGSTVAGVFTVTGYALRRQQFCVEKKLHQYKHEAEGDYYV